MAAGAIPPADAFKYVLNNGADFVLAEAARFAGLDGDDADGGVAFEQRQPQEGEEALLAGFLEVLVAGMGRRLVGHDHVARFQHQSAEPFAGFHGDAVDR